MAKSDAEINLKVNMPPPTGPGVKEIYDQLKKMADATKASLVSMRGEAADSTAAVRVLHDRIKALGSPELLKQMESLFSEGLSTAGTLDRQGNAILRDLEEFIRRVEKVFAAYNSGKISEADAVKYLKQPGTGIAMAQEKTSSLGSSIAITTNDLGQSGFATLEEDVDKIERFNAMNSEAVKNAEDMALHYREVGAAIKDEIALIDRSVPGWEKKLVLLTRTQQEYQKLENEANKRVTSLDAERDRVLQLVSVASQGEKERTKANDALAKAETNVKNVEGELASLRAKENVLISKYQEDLQKQNEAEARAAKQAIQRAEQDEKIREKELFQTQLLGKSKLELARIISELNKQRKAAADAGDSVALKKLEMQLQVTRSAMRQASMQANITRMMFMQQAQTASRLAGNIDTLTTGVSDLSDTSKLGQANITGMASSLMDLWFAMKAGMGPVGWIMMALQGVQTLIREYSKTTNVSVEQEKKLADSRKTTVETYKKIKEIIDDANRKVATANMLRDIDATYKAIADNVKNSYENIRNSYEIEEKRRTLLDNNLKTERQLTKLELDKQRITGKITEAEYAEGLAKYDFEAAQKQNDLTLEKAESAAKAASDALEIAQKEEDEASKDLANQTINRGQFSAPKEAIDLAQKEEEGAKDAMENQAFRVNYMYEQAKKLKDKADSLPNGVEKAAASVAYEYVRAKYEPQRKHLEDLIEEYESKKSLREALTDGHDVQHYLALQEEANAMYEAAKQRLETAEKELEKQKEANKQAQKNLADATEIHGETLKTMTIVHESEQSVRDTTKQEEKTEKGRKEKLDEITKDYQKKSIAELVDLKTDIKDLRSKEDIAAGSSQWELYQGYIKNVNDEIKSRKKAQKEMMTAAKVEAQNERTTKKFAAINMDSVFAAIRDGKIEIKTEEGIEEVKVLGEALKKAFAAKNSVLIEYLLTIAAEAEKNEKNHTKARNEIAKLRRKYAK